MYVIKAWDMWNDNPYTDKKVVKARTSIGMRIKVFWLQLWYDYIFVEEVGNDAKH